MKLNNNDDSHNSGLNLLIYNMLLDIESHPTWVCGLKQFRQFVIDPAGAVTPYVGVWIETFPRWLLQILLMSHPTWVCGLKHKDFLLDITGEMESHPTWVCGLKLPVT